MATAKQRAWRAKFARMYGGKKKRSASVRTRTVTKWRTRTMVRRRRFGRRSSGGKRFFGLSTKGPVLPAMGLIGIAAAAFFGRQLGSMIPVVNQQGAVIQSAAGGFALAGPAGAAAAVLKDMFMGGSPSGTSSGALL